MTDPIATEPIPEDIDRAVRELYAGVPANVSVEWAPLIPDATSHIMRGGRDYVWVTLSVPCCDLRVQQTIAVAFLRAVPSRSRMIEVLTKGWRKVVIAKCPYQGQQRPFCRADSVARHAASSTFQTLSGMFAALRFEAIHPGASQEQVAECRRHFMCGAGAMLELMNAIADAGLERAEEHDVLRRLTAELMAFRRDVAEGRA